MPSKFLPAHLCPWCSGSGVIEGTDHGGGDTDEAACTHEVETND